MKTTTLGQVNHKLKQLPQYLLEEVERYIDFITFKHLQDSDNAIPQWHQDIVAKRIKENNKAVDAFDMLDGLENE